MKKTYYRIRHTALGSADASWAYFRTKAAAQAFDYAHCASGGGAGTVHKYVLDIDKDYDEIQMIESIIYADVRSRAVEIANALNASDEWDPDLLSKLCSLAGMDNEWEAADGETFESVAYAAAEKLGVEI